MAIAPRNRKSKNAALLAHRRSGGETWLRLAPGRITASRLL